MLSLEVIRNTEKIFGKKPPASIPVTPENISHIDTIFSYFQELISEQVSISNVYTLTVVEVFYTKELTYAEDRPIVVKMLPFYMFRKNDREKNFFFKLLFNPKLLSVRMEAGFTISQVIWTRITSAIPYISEVSLLELSPEKMVLLIRSEESSMDVIILLEFVRLIEEKAMEVTEDDLDRILKEIEGVSLT